MADRRDVKIDWNKKTFLVVTGASRGLGKVIALELSQRFNNNSCVVLIARDKDKLEETKRNIESVSSPVEALICCMDLANTTIEQCQQVLLDALRETHVLGDFDQVILVRNAGSVGDVSKLIPDFTCSQEIRQYFDINLLSVTFLSSAFLDVFKEHSHRIIINISSLAAIQPFKGWSLYCTGKAAADMYFRVLAEEDTSVTVLNYAPGPLKTAMLTEVLEKAFPEVRDKYMDEKGECQALTCEYSVSKLINLLESGNFKSGDHIDVFDIV